MGAAEFVSNSAHGPGLRWTIGAVALKLILAAWLLALFNEHRVGPAFRFFQDSGDVADYVRPVENMLRFGRYTTDLADPMGAVHRMPGYALTFLPLRAVFSEDTAKSLLVGLQLLIECAALVCVGGLGSWLTGSRSGGIFALLLYAASTFVTVFSCMIVPDGLAANLTVILTWLFVRNRGEMGPGLLLATGTSYIYLVFLRPVLAPLVVPFAAAILVNPRIPMRRRWLGLALFLAVPVLAEGSWLVRNYLQVGEAIPFHVAGMRLPAPDDSLRRWLISFGGDQVWWRPGSVMAWFKPGTPFHDPAWPLPAQALTAECPLAKVLEGRTHYLAYVQGDGPDKDNHGRAVVAIFDSCRHAYEREKPLDHHVLSRLRLLRDFVVHGGPPLPLPKFGALERYSPRFWLKVGSVAIHAMTIALGGAGLVLLIAHPTRDGWFVAGIAGYLLLVFPWLRFIENRFLAVCYPFLAIGAGVAFAAFEQALSKRASTRLP